MDTKSECEERAKGSNSVCNLFHRSNGERRVGLRLAIDSARTGSTCGSSFDAGRCPNHEASRRCSQGTGSPALQSR